MAYDRVSDPEQPEPDQTETELPRAATAGTVVAAAPAGTDRDPHDSYAPRVRDAPGSPATHPSPPQNGLSSALAGSRGLLLGVGLGAAIAVGAMTLTRPSKPTAAETSAATAAPAGQSVSVSTTQQTMVPQTISTTGTIDSRDWAQVMPQATGLQIQRILVNEGDVVQAGQVIAELDKSVLQDQLNEARSQLNSAQSKVTAAQAQVTAARSQLTSAQAQQAAAQSVVQQRQAVLSQQKALLSEAEHNLVRYQALQQQGVISQQDLEARSTTATTARESVSVAQSNIASAQADVSRAQAGVGQAQAGIGQAAAGVSQAQADVESARNRIQQLETKTRQTVVRAAASGILTKKHPTDQRDVAKVGELTGTNPLFYILPDGSLELSARVPENLLAQVKVGATAQLSSPSDARIKLTGKVREITPVLNGQGLPIVKIQLNSSQHLKPGMLLKANIVVQQSREVTVPQKAVVMQADGRQVVFVVDAAQVAHAKPVDLGDIVQDQAVIKTGLEPGAQVVVQGAGFVKDGDRVTIVTP